MSIPARETIHVSLGSCANAVTAHFLNLEGLAATSSSGNDDAKTTAEAPCNPYITHAISNNTYVPRVLIVDQASQFSLSSSSSSLRTETTNAQQRHLDHPSSTTRFDDETAAIVTTWKGDVQVIQKEHGQEDPSVAVDDKSNVITLQDAASALTYSSYSRYHVHPNDTTSSSAFAATTSVTANNNERHVQWDSDEEEEVEEEEDQDERRRRKERARQRWQLNTQLPLQQEIDSFWESAAASTSTGSSIESLSWMDYWMPPHPPFRKFAVPLAYSHDSGITEHWDTYQMGLSPNTAQDLLEKLRGTLEACDSVQGLTVVTQGYGIYAGLSTALLQDFEDECRTAGRMVMNVVDGGAAATAAAQVDKENARAREDASWQVAHTERVRRQLQNGLALHDYATHANVVLPLVLDKDSSLFAASARVALALETATLPYRLNGSSRRSKIGLNGGYYGGVGPSEDGFDVATRLSFGEYLASVQPSSQYPMLELDAMVYNAVETWTQSLLQGTSLERQRMLQRGGRDANVRRPRDVLPGAWLNSPNASLMTRISPEMGGTDRSVHRHFALSSSLRPSSLDVSTFSTSQYLTFLMEGMAFRYRPEVSMGTVLSQSASALTSGGYGAGTYWKFLFPNGDDAPVLSVLSNTTRSYGFLNSVASDMKQVMSPRFKGYVDRDTAQGILPDTEDCTEALEACFDLRDAYAPPEGSGLVVNEEGTYFDLDS